MGRRGGFFALSAFVASIVVAAVAFAASSQVLRLSDWTVIGFDRMIAEIKGVNLVFVGEIHAREEHHEAQLRVIRSLHRAGVPLAIGLEMFTAECQPDLDLWVAGKIDEQVFLKKYDKNWGMPWPLYREIFLYARTNRIPLIGLNVPREIVQKVAQSGFASLTPEEKGKLPPAITCNVDSAYMAFIRKAYTEHFGTEKSLLHFCEAQMVWTKAMAWRLA